MRPSDSYFAWTEPRVDTMRTMWLAGASATQIAAAIGAPTKNVVIGKLHRLKLSAKAREEAPPPPPPSPVSGSPWSEAEIATLARLACEGTMAVCTATGRSPRSVRVQANRHGVHLARVAADFSTAPAPASLSGKAKTWTDEEVETLRTLGPTRGSQAVADALGRSRKSVASKASEIGVKFGLVLVPLSHRSKPVPVPIPPVVEIGEMRRVSILDLTASDCCWVIGDPREGDGPVYCGLPVAPGKIRCVGHHQLTYVIGSAKKIRPSVVAA